MVSFNGVGIKQLKNTLLDVLGGGWMVTDGMGDGRNHFPSQNPPVFFHIWRFLAIFAVENLVECGEMGNKVLRFRTLWSNPTTAV